MTEFTKVAVTGRIAPMSHQFCSIATNETRTQAGLKCDDFRKRLFFGDHTVTDLPDPVSLEDRVKHSLEDPFERLPVTVRGYSKDGDTRAVFVETVEFL